MSHAAPLPRPSRLRSILLWTTAAVLMLAAATWQRRSGPTYPFRGAIAVDGVEHSYRLVRSEETVQAARVVVPSPGGKVTGTLHWRRYPTQEPFAPVALRQEPGDHDVAIAVAELPIQPSAGKLEYHLELTTPGGPLRIPAGKEEIVLRYKDPVPMAWLLPHIGVMFLSMLVGMRACLSAGFQLATMRRYALVTLVGLFVGGLVLGPIVQKYAFGAFWTGFPFGYDLTDNKQLVMWVGWLLACLVLWRWPQRPGLGRAGVVLASLLMLLVYMIPHSMRGSELDYGKLAHGADPKQAIGTGQ